MYCFGYNTTNGSYGIYGGIVAFLDTHSESMSIASIVFAAATCVGNLTVIILFMMNKELQVVTNYFVLSLAMADLLGGTLAFPLTIGMLNVFREKHAFLDLCLCILSVIVTDASFSMSLISVLGISVDRWMAIVYPIKYLIWLTPNRVQNVIITTWIFGLSIPLMTVMVFGDLDASKKDTCANIQSRLFEISTKSSGILTLLTLIPSMVLLLWVIKRGVKQARTIFVKGRKMPKMPKMNLFTHAPLSSTTQTAKTFLVICIGFSVSRGVLAIAPYVALRWPSSVCTSSFGYVIAACFVIIQIMLAVNPWFYMLTNEAFRNALTRNCKRQTTKVTKIMVIGKEDF